MYCLNNAELFQQFLEHTPTAVAMCDREMRYLLTSQQWLREHRLDEQNLIGRSHYDVFPQLSQEWRQYAERCLAGIEAGYKLENGIKWQCQPWRDSTGEIGGLILSVEALATDTNIPTHDSEVGTLTQQGEAQLRQYQEQLEDLVAERTAALAEANEQLSLEIVERQQAVQALQQSEARFQKLAANVPGMIYQYRLHPDGSHAFSYVSLGCRELYELEPEQVLQDATSAFGLIHPDDRQEFEESIGISAQTLQHWQQENRLITPSGRLKWVQSSSRPEKQVNGDIVWDGLAIDISDRKLAEEALRDSQQMLQLVINNIPQGIFWKNRHSVFLGCNQAFAEAEGYESPSDIIGKTDYELSNNNQQAELFHAVDRQVMKSNTPIYHQIKQLRRRDGKLSWIDSSKIPLRDSDGNVVGLLCSFEDISDRKLAEEALHRSKAQLRELAQREQLLNRLAREIRNSLDLDTVLATAVQEIRNLLQIDRCTFAWYVPHADLPVWNIIKEAKNPSLPPTLGDYPAAMLGSVTELLLAQTLLQTDDVTAVEEPLHREFLQQLGYTSLLSLPIRTRSGQVGVITVGHCTEPHPWTESEVDLLKAVTDQLAIAINQAELYTQSREAAAIAQRQAQEREATLRELQQTQSQLIQSEKMSSLGQLVAGVAHEINNPVNFIYGNLAYADEYTQDMLRLLQLYQEQYPQPTPTICDATATVDLDFLREDLPKLLNSMKVGAERICEIVRSLRNFSRLDEAEMKEVDIHEGIESTLLILQSRFKAKPEHPAIEIVKDYGNLPPVQCYVGQLNQVFMNLLANAVDAIDEQNSTRSLEEVIANPSQIRISTTVKDNSRIAISIRDNGPGITETVKNQLFNPFFTTKPIGVGTGLGLAISYQIVVEKHQGQLTCSSQVGKGAEFTIEIAIQPEIEARNSQSAIAV
jgi:two-component system NtrC family sensor kinase